MSNSGKKILTQFVIWLIIVISFLNFSAWFYPLLDPDMAIGILMSPGYTIPGDLYFWGQSHHGSFVSMLANILIITYQFPAALACSVVHFAILIAGFFALSTLLRSGTNRILLALVWFLPTWGFTGQVVANTGIALSLLSIGIWLLNLSLNAQKFSLRMLFLSGTCLSFILSVWVADFLFIPLLIILLIAIWRLSTVFRKGYTVQVMSNRGIRYRSLVTVLFTLAGIGFLYYAKSRALKIEGFDLSLFDFSIGGIKAAAGAIVLPLIDVILFRADNFLVSLQLWLVLAGIPWLFALSYIRRRVPAYLRKQKWLLFFVISTIAIFCLLFLMRKPAFYAPVFFIFSWMALLMFVETSCSAKRSFRTIILFIIILPGALSAIVPFLFPDRIPPSRKIAYDLRNLGKTGIIAGYDHAYVMAAADPKNIHATPHDSDLIRNTQMIIDVFKQPTLLVARDGWMDAFPDTLRQFGQILVKKGDAFNSGGRELCRYEKYIYSQIFTPGQMKYQGNIDTSPEMEGAAAVKIDTVFDRTKHFVFGPFIPLRQGKIKVDFRLMAGDNLSTGNAAVLEVSADYGKKLLASRTIRWSDFQKIHHFENFDVVVDIPQDFEGVEFRIMYLGGHVLWFDQVEMIGM